MRKAIQNILIFFIFSISGNLSVAETVTIPIEKNQCAKASSIHKTEKIKTSQLATVPSTTTCNNETISISMQPTPTIKSKEDNKIDTASFNWNSLIHDLAWPFSVTIIFLSIRPVLLNLLDRLLKFKYKDTELEFLSREANDSLNKAAHGGYIGNLNISAVYESIKLNEWATLVISRMLLRKGLSQVVGDNHNLGPSPSLDKLLNICRQQQLIPHELIVDLERLREVTFFAEWWNGRIPKKSEWKWAIANCQSVVEALFDTQPVA